MDSHVAATAKDFAKVMAELGLIRPKIDMSDSEVEADSDRSERSEKAERRSSGARKKGVHREKVLGLISVPSLRSFHSLRPTSRRNAHPVRPSSAPPPRLLLGRSRQSEVRRKSDPQAVDLAIPSTTRPTARLQLRATPLALPLGNIRDVSLQVQEVVSNGRRRRRNRKANAPVRARRERRVRGVAILLPRKIVSLLTCSLPLKKKVCYLWSDLPLTSQRSLSRRHQL